eukprot:GHVS01071964.1.p1 GENE.GHVS01071964.1~~GHVS01071964.1.p1  ORF type:complete len:197 (-),score=19.32 GHVS01071964.1:63-593(-)
MFLLSRRSAVFALFVILAFATSTLLASNQITAEQRHEGAKLCFGYHGGDWHKVIMMNSIHQIFEAEDGSGNIVFGLEKVSDTENRCVVWDVSKPTRRFLVDPKTRKGTIYEQFVYKGSIDKQSNCYLVLLSITAPELLTSGEISKEWEMSLYFDINRGNPSPKLHNFEISRPPNAV